MGLLLFLHQGGHIFSLISEKSLPLIRSKLCRCVWTNRNRTCVGTWPCSITCWSQSKGFLATSCCSKTTWRSCLTTLSTVKTQRVRRETRCRLKRCSVVTWWSDGKEWTHFNSCWDVNNLFANANSLGWSLGDVACLNVGTGRSEIWIEHGPQDAA